MLMKTRICLSGQLTDRGRQVRTKRSVASVACFSVPINDWMQLARTSKAFAHITTVMCFACFSHALLLRSLPLPAMTSARRTRTWIRWC